MIDSTWSKGRTMEYLGWSIGKTFPNGYWHAANIIDGQRERLTADTLAGAKESIRERSAERLEYLRAEIEAERISSGEIAELQELAPLVIEQGDILLMQWAGVPEFEESED